MKVYGLVLAGGRSSRFGAEKAAAEVSGRSMIAWVLDVLTPACAAVAVNAGPGTKASAYGERAGYVTLADDPSDPQGPLAGLRAGLAWAQSAGADALATAPCDTPFLPADFVTRLADGWAPGDGARVAVSPAGPAPLCALWPVPAALDLVSETLAAGRHPSIRQVLEALRAVEVEFPDPRAFDNLNTPADYAAAIFGLARPER
jgi:molybdopterin-guanine dinucleotide biosynthesis protein A